MKSNRGFTLVEVVVAVFIITLMGAATLRVFSTSVKNDNDTKRHVKANYVAQNVMESEKAKRAEKIDFQEDGEGKSIPKYFDESGDDVTSQVSQISDTRGYIAKVEYSKYESNTEPEAYKENPEESPALETLLEINVSVYFNEEKEAELSSLARKSKK
ncbi:MAG: prepilin-type N-terminal cleavage/methylation domain-containing protein [Peptoclostridium sp.]|uniref:type IV pilus modification PilV family protein n=1 Tax=Peptoclostridium sp. TaxID=1904860 RepID=UPI00139D5AA1|nr:type II secretion system protein [Peptoclostridium sp.]MZQ76389.1 prepilin-type N-terminal cleavage/methylation domain-containing protein [Peptoclostridium sp.]